MTEGFSTAWGEITLVVFTTLAPAGSVASGVVGCAILTPKTDEITRKRLNNFLGIPLAITLVGLVLSTAHLGNPSNALYVLTGVGRSPLSNEVASAVVFLTLLGLYWLYGFSEHPRKALQRIWLGCALLAGLVFLVAVAFAYDIDTIISWNSVYVPINLVLSAAFGGCLLAQVVFVLAHYDQIQKGVHRFLLGGASCAYLVNIIGFVGQGVSFSHLANGVGTADTFIPYYVSMVCGFGILGAVALFMMAWAFHQQKKRLLWWVGLAVFIAFLGIAFMRFAFYLIHMTVGISF